MIENEEKQLLDEIMKDSSPVLFLGAGFSKGSKNENNTLDGKGIWNLILESLVLKKADESDIDEIKGYNLYVNMFIHYMVEKKSLRNYLHLVLKELNLMEINFI